MHRQGRRRMRPALSQEVNEKETRTEKSLPAAQTERFPAPAKTECSAEDKRKALKPSRFQGFYLVRVTGFEPAASCSQSRRATSCATPGYSFFAGVMSPAQCRQTALPPFTQYGAPPRRKTWRGRLLCIFGAAAEHPVYGPAAARCTGGTTDILYRRLPFSSILCYNKSSFKKILCAGPDGGMRRVYRRLRL